MAIPLGAIVAASLALGAAALGSSKAGRDMLGDLGKLGLTAVEKALRRMAGDAF